MWRDGDDEDKDRKVVREYLINKNPSLKELYAQAADDSDVKAASEDADRASLITGIASGLGQIATASSAARGGQGFDSSALQGIASAKRQKVADAQRARQARIDDVMTQDRLGQAEDERARRKVEQGRSDEQYGRQQADWARTDKIRADEDDPNSQVSKDYQAILGQMGGDPRVFAGRSATELKAKLPLLEKKYELEQRSKDRATAAADRAAARGDAKAAKDEIRQEKQQREDEQLSVPGYAPVSGVRVRPEEAGKLRDAKGQMDALRQNLADYKRLVKENGSFEFGGKAGAQMESLATSIKMNAKNLYELGALSGPDMGVIESQIQSPTSMSNLFSRDSTVIGGLDQTLDTLNKGFEAKMSAKGYQPDAGAGRTVVVSNGKETLTIPIEDLADAQNDGFAPVTGMAGGPQ